MQELIIRPNESIVLKPGESIVAGEQPLRIRVGQVNTGDNEFENMERMSWELSRDRTGNQVAIYRRGNESRLIAVIPERPNPASFDFEGQAMTATIRTFKAQKADLDGWLPEEGDTLEYDEKTYIFRKTSGLKTFYENVGSYDVVMRIFVILPSSQE